MDDKKLFEYKPVVAIKRAYAEPPVVRKDNGRWLPKRKPTRP